MSHRAERQTPVWWITVIVLIVLLLGLGAAVYTRTDTPTATAATDPTVDADTAKLAAAEAEQVTCRSLSAQVRSVASRLDHQFHLHHEAHRQMVAGKISQEERNKIWATTLAARVELSALLHQAIKAAKAQGC